MKNMIIILVNNNHQSYYFIKYCLNNYLIQLTFDNTMSNCSSVIINASWSLIDNAAIQVNCLKAEAP